MRQALDDQLRMKQYLTCQERCRDSKEAGVEIHEHRIPDLNQKRRFGFAQGVGATLSLGQGCDQARRPYMSALSEMNGRPLHVRQQEFEKESQYRRMLLEQIEENKRRKARSYSSLRIQFGPW